MLIIRFVYFGISMTIDKVCYFWHTRTKSFRLSFHQIFAKLDLTTNQYLCFALCLTNLILSFLKDNESSIQSQNFLAFNFLKDNSIYLNSLSFEFSH